MTFLDLETFKDGCPTLQDEVNKIRKIRDLINLAYVKIDTVFTGIREGDMKKERQLERLYEAMLALTHLLDTKPRPFKEEE